MLHLKKLIVKESYRFLRSKYWARAREDELSGGRGACRRRSTSHCSQGSFWCEGTCKKEMKPNVSRGVMRSMKTPEHSELARLPLYVSNITVV